MHNRLPLGPGSRGGRWHVPDFRHAYQRAWRAAHPEYREREKLRRARARSSDPAGIAVGETFPRPLPEPAVTCVCACGCRERVVVFCGWCRDGIHGGDEAPLGIG
jgi:hypothetical protein